MAAAPPPGRRCPCTACSSRESPRGAPRQEQQAASGCPIGQMLPQSQRRAGGRLEKWAFRRKIDLQHSTQIQHYAQCCRPSQRPRRSYPFRIPTAPPLALAAPAPHPRTTAAAAAGRAFPLGRLLRPGHRAGRARTRSAAQPLPSLHDPRHRSCTGSRLLAALPSHAALRQRSGSAAAAGSGQGIRNETGNGPVHGPNSAYNVASVMRNCAAIAGRSRPRITPVIRITGPGKDSGSRRARATSGSG